METESTSLFALRLLQRTHGHLGWLAVAVLLHPVFTLRYRQKKAPRAGWAVGLSTAFVSLTAALGACAYPAYRRLLKRELFLNHSWVGWWFERKEHLAVGAVGFAWIGLCAYLGRRYAIKSEDAARLVHCARFAYVVAFFLAFSSAAIGTFVSAFRSFLSGQLAKQMGKA